MAKAVGKCDCVCCLFVCSTNFCVHDANCSYERENILTMNSSRMNLIDCRGHLETMEYMKSHGV
jgi:hypothetical protein